MSVVVDYIEEEFEDTQKDKFLTFSLDDEIYGLDISYVLEIIGVQKITQVPKQRSFIKGVINLRGKIIPVMDIRSRFEKESREYDELTCVVVIDIADLTVGIIVDTVVEVLSIQKEQISDPLKFEDRSFGNFIQGIGKVGNAVKLLLDVEQLIMHESGEMFSEQTLLNRKES
jgi:purine-binding chemotaxis protein CheW